VEDSHPQEPLNKPVDFMNNPTRTFVTTSVATATLFLLGCTTTDRMEVKDTSGFLGDYSQLRPGTENEAALVFIDSSVDFSQYSKVHIVPVALWEADDDSSIAKLSPEDQQLLVDYLYSSLEEKLSSDYQLVDQPGDGVLVVRTAITEARKSNPVINVASKVTPIGLGLTYSKKLVTGTFLGVGKVGLEAELVDGGTTKRLAAVVDRGAGGNLVDNPLDTWGDVKDVFDHWARRFQTRLAQLRQGQ